ncbi:hypothetical protein N8203_04195, partial [Crocinitomicaceae bacterium]|nr:hypothetical protein [Crocinitomicaceae bacterium]
MGWGSAAANNVKLNNQDLSVLLENDENINEIFEESLEFLREHEVVFPKRIVNPIFFRKLGYYNSFASGPMTYDSIRDHILEEEYYMSRPSGVFEFLVSMAFFSTKFPNTILEVGVGDMAYCWLDLNFKNGTLVELNRYYYDWNEKKNKKLDDDELEELDAFTCSE